MKTLLFALGLVCWSSQIALAQRDPDEVKHRNNCRIANQTLAAGHPEPQLEWARGYISLCGANVWANAASAEITRTKAADRDSVVWQVWTSLKFLRDATLLETVRSIATDPTASLMVRTQALLTLHWYLTPGASVEAYNDFSQPLPVVRGREVCHIGRLAGRQVEFVGRPFPIDYEASIRSIAQRIKSDPSQPEVLRRLSTCF
jgi:hypothetical protein